MRILRYLTLSTAVLLAACAKTKRNPPVEASATVEPSANVGASAEGDAPADTMRLDARPPCDAARPATETWARRWEVAGAVGVTVDGDGQPLLQVNGQKGQIDLIKLNSRGETAWSHAFAGNGKFPIALLLATNRRGNSAVFSQAPVAGKLVPFGALVDNAGKVKWQRSPVKSQPAYWDPMAVSIDAEDGAAVLGFANYPVDLGNGLIGGQDRHAFLFKLDADGKLRFSLALGGLVDTPKLGSFPDGSVLLAATLRGDLSFGDAKLSSASGAPFIAKLSPTGKVIFARVLASDEEASVHDLVVAADGSSYLGLAFSGSLDLGSQRIQAGESRSRALLKFDTAGEAVWSKVLGPSPVQLSLTVSPDQDVVVAAGFRGAITLDDNKLEGGEWSTFAAKIGSAGNVKWHQQWPGAPETSPTLAANDCGIFVGVSFRKEYDTGKGKVDRERPIKGVSAAALVHLLPPGN